MTRTIPVKCPSGMEGEVRAWTVKEANMMSQATKRKAQQVIEDVLTSCWVRTTTSGPYEHGGDKPDWQDILMGDSQYILIKIREATHTAIYTFKWQCDSHACREKFQWDVDLIEQLHVQELHPDDVETFKAGNEFKAVIDGIEYTYQLPTGSIAKRAERGRAQNRQEQATHALKTRITAVEGVESRHLRKHLENLRLDIALDLIAEFDEHDCGVDADIEIECEHCGNIMDVQLPFEAEFFFPTGKARRKERRRERSAS